MNECTVVFTGEYNKFVGPQLITSTGRKSDLPLRHWLSCVCQGQTRPITILHTDLTLLSSPKCYTNVLFFALFECIVEFLKKSLINILSYDRQQDFFSAGSDSAALCQS